MSIVFATLTFAVLGQVAGPEADDLESAQEVQKRKWEEFYRAEAASYTIMLEGDRQKVLKLVPEPVLHWSNPVRRGDTNGSVFVWTHEGRAEVVGTVFSHLARNNPGQRLIAHSFHTLSLKPLVAERRETRAWSFQVPGIEPKEIPDAPAVASTRPLRLAQMRNLAREFSATTDLEDVDLKLRLLSQPIYRYAGATADVVDGALFTFVTGTDPELMLVIEARGTPENLAWHFGAGRFTNLALQLRHKQALLWTYEEGFGEPGTTPYLSRRTELRDGILK